LAQTEKFSILSPDFNTLWNYRREIISHLFQSMDAKARLEMVKAELMMLIKGIKRSPKSYTLWYQRQWAIEIGLKEEAKLIEENTWRSTILDMELGLCS
jgi:geranylgeranyl transferase type-2 subunit alpha